MDVPFLSLEDRETLQKSVLCKFMEDNLFQRFIGSGHVRTFKKSDTFFEQGVIGDDLFIVMNGWAQIKRDNADGSATQIAVFQEGDGIAEIAAILGKPYPATGQAMSDLRVFAFSGKILLDILHDDREALAAILSSLYAKLHELVNNVEVLKAYTIKQRLVLFLLQNIDCDTKVEFELPYNKAFIAAHIGTSPAQLSRTFQDLRKYGVSVDGKIARIEDPSALRRVLSVQ